MTRARLARAVAGVAAAALAALSAQLPLWSMTMRAPQYPRGLHLYAYGSSLGGDVNEINILNHYIGMPPIEAPALETALFPYGIAALVLICLLSPLHRWLRRLAIAATLSVPVMILADLQWRLYSFGHSLNPKAPIRLEPFTPLVIGETAMGNFVSTGMVSWGVACIIAASLVLMIGARLADRWSPPAAAAVRMKQSRADRVPYDLWAEQGHLETTPGRAIQYEYVAQWLHRFWRDHRRLKIAFDRWGMRHLRPWLIKAGFTDDQVDEVFVEFGQGFQSMSPAMRELESALLEQKVRHGGHPVLTMCMASAVVTTDPAGNRKLNKAKAAGRIDGAVSLTMAFGVAPTERAPERKFQMIIL